LYELRDSTHFQGPNFRGWHSRPSFTQIGRANYTKFWEDKEQSSALLEFVSVMRIFIHQANMVDNDKQYKPTQIKQL